MTAQSFDHERLDVYRLSIDYVARSFEAAAKWKVRCAEAGGGGRRESEVVDAFALVLAACRRVGERPHTLVERQVKLVDGDTQLMQQLVESVAIWAAMIRSGYAFWSTKPSGSTEARPASRSSNEPSSRRWSIRPWADMRR